MKKLILISGLLIIASCGNKTSTDQNQSNDETELTIEQEQVIADSLSMELDKARENLGTATQENLSEIDSLLENF